MDGAILFVATWIKPIFITNMTFGSKTILQKTNQIINTLSPEIRNDVKSL